MSALFISYASDDQAVALEVCARLEAQGIRCWIAPRDVAPGAQWDEAIVDAITAAGAFLLVLTSAANGSSFVKNEVNHAFTAKRPIFTFRVEDVQPSKSLGFYLARHHWTDGFPAPMAPKLAQLAAAVTALLPTTEADAAGSVPTSRARAGGNLPTKGRSWWRRDISVGFLRWKEPARGRLLWRRALPFAVTAIITGVMVAGVAYNTRPPLPAPPIVTRFSFALGDGQQFTNQGRQLVAISPDGTQMVYVANQRLWLRSMSDPNARPIPGTEIAQGVLSPVFSPDGRSLAFFSGADLTLKRIAVSGGAPVTLCPASSPFGMSWGTDGIVFGQAPGGIMRVSANGGTPELLVGVKTGEQADGPQMLPGGQLVLFTIATGTSADRWDKAQVVVQSLTSGERTTLIENGSGARYLPTGHIVYALGGVLYAVPLDLRRLRVTVGAVPILEGIRRPNGQQTGVAHFSVANGGSLMFIPGPVSAGGAQLEVALFDGKFGAETLKLPPGAYTSPRVSPDGKHVAFGNNDGKEVSVWIAELSGASSMRRLTFGGNNQYPIWSPDGQRVAFNSDREGDQGIFWQKSDGTDTAERLTRPEQGIRHVPKSWSPDGKQFLFEAVKGSSVSLWTFSLQDRKSTLIAGVQSTESSLNPVFSPDGRWIAYQSNQTGGQVQVYVQPFSSTGAKYQITKNGGFAPVWSPDGTRLFYLPGIGQFVVVTIATQPRFTFGNPEPLQRGWFEGGLGGPRVHDILPDGKRFIAVVPAGETSSGAATTPQINVVLNWFEELKRLVPVK